MTARADDKGKPILFSAPMVRALLAGRKTQTRRVLNILRKFGKVTQFDRSDTAGYDWHFRDKRMRWNDIRHERLLEVLPYCVGDRLYVREAWFAPVIWDSAKPSELPPTVDRAYEADGGLPGWAGRYRAARFMPRAFSRLTLIVEAVRVQRLQEIAAADAMAEGIEPQPHHCGRWLSGVNDGLSYPSSTCAYAGLWNTINGAGSWERNPFVAAYTFRVIRANIDAEASS